MAKATTRLLKATDLFFSLREGDLIALQGHYPSVESPQAVVLRGSTKAEPHLVVMTLDDQKILTLGLDDVNIEKHTAYRTVEHVGRVTQMILNFS